MRANEQRARSGRVSVEAFDELVQAVSNAIVELRYALAFRRGDDGRVLFWCEPVREVLGKDVVSRRRRMIETSETVELPKTGFEVDGCFGDFRVVAVLGGAGCCERCEGLDAAVERAGVDCIYGWVGGEEVLGQLLGLCDAIAGECWVGGNACR